MLYTISQHRWCVKKGGRHEGFNIRCPQQLASPLGLTQFVCGVSFPVWQWTLLKGDCIWKTRWSEMLWHSDTRFLIQFQSNRIRTFRSFKAKTPPLSVSLSSHFIHSSSRFLLIIFSTKHFCLWCVKWTFCTQFTDVVLVVEPVWYSRPHTLEWTRPTIHPPASLPPSLTFLSKYSVAKIVPTIL